MLKPSVITDPDFEQEVLQSSQPVLVYFWADWCGPCRLVSPTVDFLTTEYADRLKVVKMAIDPNPLTVSAYKVEGVPALRLFKSGKLEYTHEGAIGKQALIAALDSYL
ncbi:MAG: thioredoxin [Coleofasciculaceae cyanobacterium SM2_1_6]|nr:thioredoxin [Coleofasciculaceae cyanobacterium SM2_1_6]